jgi:hypothetical protein
VTIFSFSPCRSFTFPLSETSRAQVQLTLVSGE